MKNLIIAILGTYIFYTQFCVVKGIEIIPFAFLIIWFSLISIDLYAEDRKEAEKRHRKLQYHIRRAKRA